MNVHEQKRRVSDHDKSETRKFLKGMAWGVFFSILVFWAPLIWWLS